MAEDVGYVAVASMADGMVGAELAPIDEVAAINMMRDGIIEVILPPLRLNFSLIFQFKSIACSKFMSFLGHHVTS